MSKELFFNMRAEDMALMYSENFTKKDAIKVGIDLVSQIYENGSVEPIKVFANIVRLKEVINAADKEFRDKISIISNDSYNGVTFTHVNPRESLNYEEDLIFLQLSEKLKERQDLVKLSSKSKDIIFDSEGVEVPKVSSKFTKSSINISF